MADTKISDLTDGVTAPDTDEIPAARAGANVKLKLSYVRSAPAGAAFQSYNLDGATNYERATMSWSSNVFTIAVEKGGTGTLRQLTLKSGTATLRLEAGTGAGQDLIVSTGDAGAVNSNCAVRIRANSADIGYFGRISSVFGIFTSAAAKALTIDSSTGVATVSANTATPAGGSTSAVLLFGTTAGFGVYYGSGAPTVSAGQGSLYLRSDGSSTSTRLYVNTNGSTTWTNVTTAA